MDWPQIFTIIGSILIPTMGGFAWIITRMDKKFEDIRSEMKTMEMSINSELKSQNSELKSQGERLARIKGAIWSRYTGTGNERL